MALISLRVGMHGIQLGALAYRDVYLFIFCLSCDNKDFDSTRMGLRVALNDLHIIVYIE